MKPEEAIEIIWEKHMDCEDYHLQFDSYPNGYDFGFDQAILIAAQALEEVQQYREIGASPERITELILEGSAAKRILGHYQKIGTVEECRKAVENKKKCEKQWHNDMENPLEPIKVYSALKSEILKLELRIKNRPKDISILDYTVIAALQKVLKNNLEAMEDE